jgi:tetrahydromethanopterin S-methyltransferase subunit C
MGAAELSVGEARKRVPLKVHPAYGIAGRLGGCHITKIAPKRFRAAHSPVVVWGACPARRAVSNANGRPDPIHLLRAFSTSVGGHRKRI